MTDLIFNDIVTIKSNHTGVKAHCKTCSTWHTVTRDELSKENLRGDEHVPLGVDSSVKEYIAGMRAWNCCHEGNEPRDGFPEKPDVPGYNFGTEH